VNDACCTRRFEPAPDVANELHDLRQCEASVAAQMIREIFAVETLHRDVRERGVWAPDLEDTHDVGDVERGRDLRLSEEASNELGVREHVSLQELHGGDLSRRRMGGFVDLPHCATADQFSDPVVPQDGVGEATESASAQRCLQILPGFFEESFTLRNATDGFVMQLEGANRRLARVLRREEGGTRPLHVSAHIARYTRVTERKTVIVARLLCPALKK